MDPGVPPVARKPHRVPFALRDKVKAKIDELLRDDIIEEVAEPTGWVSPVVIIPKPNGDIRLCVDMRQANTAVLRERYPTPTVEEVLHDINGSTVFSKLDLRWGFHQVELDAASRNITTFVVEDGLYRFKRLSSAPEKFPEIIQQVISGCAGALNIADDIIVYGRTLEEHNANLFRVLNRLQDRGLTLNGKKCWFRQSEITFFGLRVSANGVAATPETVQAIVNAPAPQSAAEVRSFLGTIGFSARFLHDLATTTEPLRQLTRTGTAFTWGSEQQKAFNALKAQLTAAPALAFFDKDAVGESHPKSDSHHCLTTFRNTHVHTPSQESQQSTIEDIDYYTYQRLKGTN